MSLNALVHAVLRRVNPTNSDDEITPYQANTSKLSSRLLDVFLRTYHLGFTAFGGPPVHFQIFHRRFVDGMGKTPWIDEQTFQELFALSQALPGPASTKMLFNIAQIHAGIIPALFVFLLWSLPGAIGMYGLSLGVQRINDKLPGPAYALLSGLNAATVGIIALAAVQLARKAITDPLTRILVAFGGCAGLCYNALWYFPTLLVFGGFLTLFWDHLGGPWVRKWKSKRRARRSLRLSEQEKTTEANSIPMQDIEPGSKSTESLGPQRRRGVTANIAPANGAEEKQTPPIVQPSSIDISSHTIPVKIGLALIVAFLGALAIFLSLRGALRPAPLLLALFNNMFLAGTIIFGGGPVVIPLLRSYVVDPGWVSPRDFLLGLAVIQAMPGPNFNFAIYLGALTVAGPASNRSIPTVVGALLGFLGIFTPGLWLSVGFQSIWRQLRKRKEVASVLRGINAAAVGFVFTAVYRLWEIGYLTPDESKGISLGQEPWWLVVAATTFTVVEWFSVPPPVAILSGGVAGLGWWGAVGRH
ncbi:chromate transporter-domain-containing protein [Crassisporium funariophilum]|nr:chromate transporter-domain-containing protein [Crassisporium funariophilum]